MDTDEERDLTSTDQPSEAPDPGSSETLDAPISLTDAQVAQVLDHPEFSSRVEAAAENKAKSVKDKRFNKIENQQADILAQMELTPEQQAVFDEAKTQARIKALEEASASGNEELASPEPQTTYSLSSVFEKFGYDLANITPEMTELVAKNPSKEELENALFKLKKSLPKQTETTGAGAIQEGGGGAPKSPEGEALIGEYTEKMLAARGKPDEIKALRAEYKERGLDVATVTIGMGSKPA